MHELSLPPNIHYHQDKYDFISILPIQKEMHNAIPGERERNCLCVLHFMEIVYVAKILYASVESIRQLNGAQVFLYTSLLQCINQT